MKSGLGIDWRIARAHPARATPPAAAVEELTPALALK